MADAKRPLFELVSKGVDHLATPANLRYGRAIHERGGVEFIENDTYKVTAWVGGLDGDTTSGGGQRRRTRLSSTQAGLRWHCAGNPKKHDIFCKHCVALALAIRARARGVDGRHDVIARPRDDPRVWNGNHPARWTASP